jgi:pimeloyl-ACP methyl ester carboxylesterase
VLLLCLHCRGQDLRLALARGMGMFFVVPYILQGDPSSLKWSSLPASLPLHVFVITIGVLLLLLLATLLGTCLHDPTRIDTARLAFASSVVQDSDDIRWIDTPGAHVRVRLRFAGDGSREMLPVVVFLLDPPNVVEHYDVHVERLAPASGGITAGVACIELPGFGFSIPNKTFRWSFEDYVQSVGATLDALFPLERYPAGLVLVAPCVCAYIALRLAKERERQIIKLVLAQAPCWEDEVSWSRRLDTSPALISRPVVGQIVNAVTARNMARKWYRVATGEKELIPRLTAIAELALNGGACFCLASFSQCWFGALVPAPSFSAVSQPTLYLWGERDRSHRRSTPRSGLEAYAPGAKWELLPDTGHFPDLEYSARFLTRLETFLTHGH